jgi:serine/threonine protein kinase
MNPKRWQQIDKLFQKCLELDREASDAFLNEACAHDADLKAKVEALLAIDSENWDFIESPALESAAPLLANDQPRFAPGARVAHYEIVELIGRGGMGEVYVAKDEILNRAVALKFLAAEYTKDKDRLLRFQREAQAASALNHPNILTIHQLGNVDGQQFIATELIEGETLRSHLSREPVTLTEALDYSVQVAGALAAAHRAGIVHRDIKPENIMVRPDGYVKVLDFGVAKLGGYPDQHTASRPIEKGNLSSGLLMGTLRYMSPEQARGGQVDPRSDIFSLGVVLYEMIAGQTPFHGETPRELIDSVLNEEPRSLDMNLPNLSDRLVRLVHKALSKNRETRYRDAGEFLFDLKAVKQELDLESNLRNLTSPALSVPAPLSPNLTQRTSSALLLSFARPIAGLKKHKAALALVLTVLAIGAASLVYLPRKQKALSLGTWSEKAPMPRPRAGTAVAALDGQIFVASGGDDSGTTAAVDVYDPATDKWTPRANIPTARSNAEAAGIDGKLYVFGGCGRNSEGNHDCRVGTTNVLEVYDPQTNTWTTKAPMPTPRSDMAASVIGGKLYVAGGRGPCPPCSAYQVLEVYDPDTDNWDVTKAPLPVAVTGASGAALNGKFYVTGGDSQATAEPKRSNLLMFYDPVTNKWDIGPPLPTPRGELGLEAVHGVLYAIGGVATNEESNVVEAYDPVQNAWSTKAPLPVARVDVRPVAINGVIYVAGSGGRVSRPLATLHAYTAVCPGSSCISSPPGVIGWWPGDQNENDLAGPNNGTIEGKITFEKGIFGLAFNLDGSSFVTMLNPPALNLTGNQVTISGWIKPRTNAPAIYFGKTDYGFNDYLLMYGRGLDAVIKLSGMEVTVLGYTDFPSKTKLYVPPIGDWTHVALTYDGSLITLYANGELVGQAAQSGNISGDDVPFNIGGRANDEGTGKFNGLIDEVQVFNRALSREEIRTISDRGSSQCKPQARCG